MSKQTRIEIEMMPVSRDRGIHPTQQIKDRCIAHKREIGVQCEDFSEVRNPKWERNDE